MIVKLAWPSKLAILATLSASYLNPCLVKPSRTLDAPRRYFSKKLSRYTLRPKASRASLAIARPAGR